MGARRYLMRRGFPHLPSHHLLRHRTVVTRSLDTGEPYYAVDSLAGYPDAHGESGTSSRV